MLKPYISTAIIKIYIIVTVLDFNVYNPGKFCNQLLTEILTEVPISHS